MALSNRLTTQLDITGNVSALEKALTDLGKQASTFATQLGGAGKDNKNVSALSRQMGGVLKQAQTLQTILDAIQSKKGGALLADLDVQKLGKSSAAVGKIRQQIDSVTSASQTLDRRLVDVNKRFAELNKAGRFPDSRSLSKQFKLEEAKKDLQQLEGQLKRLDRTALLTPSKGQSTEIRRIRTEIDAAYASLQKFAAKGTAFNFTDRINGISKLQGQLRQLITLEGQELQQNIRRGIAAQETAQKIIAASDAERAATLRRAASKFAFPDVTVANLGKQGVLERQIQAEQRLTTVTAQRLRIQNMINAAVERGAPTRTIERLNGLYGRFTNILAQDLALIKQVNRELANTPEMKSKRINEYLFGDGGVSFTKRIAGAALIGSGVFAVINAVRQGAQFVVEFEDSLKQLQAISGSTDGQMTSLASSITDVARESKYSTIEIAKAATVIAQAGFASSELNEVLSGAVMLSTASGSTPEQAVDTLTGILGAFRLQASDTTTVVDSMVTALNRTKLSIDQVQLAVQYAGATAEQTNTSFQELVTLAASLAQAGIRRGSVIGTGLRQQQEQFLNPSDKMQKELERLGLTLDDINPKANSHIEIVRKLTEAGFSAAAAYDTMGTRGAASFLALSNQLPVYDQLAVAVAEGGSAIEAQESALDSFSSQWQIMLNILGEITAAIAGPFIDAFKTLLVTLNFVLTPIAELLGFMQELTGSSNIATVVVRVLTGAVVGLGVAMKFGLGLPVTIAIGAVVGLMSAFGGLSGAMDKNRTKVAEANAAYDSQQTKIDEVESSIQKLIDRQNEMTDGSAALQVETINLSKQFQDLQLEILETDGSYAKLIGTMQRYSVEQRKIAGELAQDKKATAQGLLQESVGNIQYQAGLGLGRARSLFRGSSVGGDIEKLLKRIQTDSFADPEKIYRDIIRTRTTTQNAANDNQLSRAQRESFLSILNEMEELAQGIKQVTATIKTADIQIGQAEALTDGGYLAKESQVSRGLLGIASDDEKTRETAYNNLKGYERQLTEILKTKGKGTSEYAALTGLLGRVVAALRDREYRALQGVDETSAKDARTGTPIDDADNLARFVESQGLRVSGKYEARSGPSAHPSGRARDVNFGTGSVEADVASQRAALDKLALDLQAKGARVIWNGFEYPADGSPRKPYKGKNKHRDHLHYEVPKMGITVGGAADAGADANTEAERLADEQARDLFSLQKARAANRVGGAQSTISTIIKESKAGTYGPAELRARMDAALAEFVVASLAKFDTDNPVEDLTAAALEERSLARQELVEGINEKVDGFKADLSRQIGDYATGVFDDAIDAIDRELDDAVYAAESPVRDIESRITRANSPLNRRSNADEGTQYYLQQSADAARLSADQKILLARRAAGSDKANALSVLQREAAAYPEDQKSGQNYLDLQKKIAEATADLNIHRRESLELQESINARTQEYLALPLNERLKQGVAAWADQSGVMDTYQDVLANNVVPALNMVTDGLSTMISNLAQGKASIAEALGSMLSSIADFVIKLIAKAMALMAIKWFLSLIGLQLADGPGGVTIESVGKLKGGEIPEQMTGGLAGRPAKFQYGGSVPRPFISQGVSNRDGVPAYLAQGEYVLRREAVKSIGLPVMDEINKFGAKALGNMQQSPIIMGGGGTQQTNVYVVSPEEKPQLGPNDVLAIISNDVLRGGTTKKLIKSVSNG